MNCRSHPHVKTTRKLPRGSQRLRPETTMAWQPMFCGTTASRRSRSSVNRQPNSVSRRPAYPPQKNRLKAVLFSPTWGQSNLLCGISRPPWSNRGKLNSSSNREFRQSVTKPPTTIRCTPLPNVEPRQPLPQPPLNPKRRFELPYRRPLTIPPTRCHS